MVKGVEKLPRLKRSRHKYIPVPKAFSIRVKQEKDLMPERRPPEIGRTSGLGLCQYIAVLFRVNAELNPSRKMTDEVLKKLILQEFPDNKKSCQKLKDGRITMGYWRTLYNLGHLTHGKKPMKHRKRRTDLPWSYRYDVHGNKANPITGRAL